MLILLMQHDLCRYDRLAHKLDTRLSPVLSEAHKQAVGSSLELLMSRAGQSTTASGTIDGSSTSLADANQRLEVSRKNTYLEMLSEIGMSGMERTFNRWHGHQTEPGKATQMTACLADLVGLILLQ
jgi:hypothetical protein